MRKSKFLGQADQKSNQINKQNNIDSDFVNIDLKYLMLAMNLLRALLRRAILTWSTAGQDPREPIRGLVITHIEAKDLIELEPFLHWGHVANLVNEDNQILDGELEKAKAALNSFVNAHIAFPPRFLRLLDSFNLYAEKDADEQDQNKRQLLLEILLLCIAPEIDTSVEQIYGYLQDNVARRRASIQLIFKILGKPGVEQLVLARYFSHQHPLIKYRILEVGADPAIPWIHQQVKMDDTVLAWILGYYLPDKELADAARFDELESLSAETGVEHNHLFEDINLPTIHQDVSLSRYPLVLAYGRNKFAKRIATYRLAVSSKKPILTIAVDKAIAAGCPPLKVIQLALRDARITEAIVFFTGWDACLDEERRALPQIVEELGKHPGIVVIASNIEWHIHDNDMARPFILQEFPISGFEERKKQWRYFLELPGLSTFRAQPNRQTQQSNQTEEVPNQWNVADDLLDKVARSFTLESASIRDAAYYARSMTAQSSHQRTEEDILFSAARAYASPNLGTLAKRVELRHWREDLILEPTQLSLLDEMKSAIENRQKVLIQWGVGKQLASSKGIVALFVGSSGTGKTLAAQIIANELGYPLYKIDLAMVVSKYIGETEKHLRNIFDEAASTNAILFFDEADSLFGKRTDIREAHDRFANQEVSDLLQRIENYDGVAILATNLLGNIDDAFKRRLQFIIDFPFPTVEERKKLWERLLSSADIPGVKELISTDTSSENTAFSQNIINLAQHELSGGNIRNAIITAAYQAADCKENRLTMKNLEYGVQSELQKIGRLVDYNEFGSQMAKATITNES